MTNFTLAPLSHRTTGALLAASVTMLLLAGLLAFSRSTVHAATNQHNVIAGLATTDMLISTDWHLSGSALDTVKTTGTTGGSNVYWQSHHVKGPTAIWATAVVDSSGCRAFKASVGSVGNIWYWHVNSTLAVGSGWLVQANSGWTISPRVGTVVSSGATCTWTGAHVHQGGSLSSNNSGLISLGTEHDKCDDPGWPGVDCRISPVGDWNNRYLHTVEY